MLRCPKCGAKPVYTSPRYHDGNSGVRGCNYFDHGKRRDEHLHYYCACGYDWTTQIASPQEVKP